MANDNVLVSAATLTKIGDAIRAKGGTTAKIKPADMPTAIANIKIPNVRRKINIVNPSPDKQIVHVDYLQDPVSITESTVIDTSPRIHSYVWATQGYKGGDLNIDSVHTLTEDEIELYAPYVRSKYGRNFSTYNTAFLAFSACKKLGLTEEDCRPSFKDGLESYIEKGK